MNARWYCIRPCCSSDRCLALMDARMSGISGMSAGVSTIANLQATPETSIVRAGTLAKVYLLLAAGWTSSLYVVSTTDCSRMSFTQSQRSASLLRCLIAKEPDAGLTLAACCSDMDKSWSHGRRRAASLAVGQDVLKILVHARLYDDWDATQHHGLHQPDAPTQPALRSHPGSQLRHQLGWRVSCAVQVGIRSSNRSQPQEQA